MKKISTYYFAIIIALNLFFGYCVSGWNRTLVKTYSDLFDGARLPPLTEWHISIPWWPYLVAGICGLGLLVSLLSKITSTKLAHVVFVILVLDALLMLTTMIAYIAPFIPMVCDGSCLNQ